MCKGISSHWVEVLGKGLKWFIINLEKPNKEECFFNYFLQYVNRLLRESGKDVKIRNKNFNSHSFRKSGSKYIWESNRNCDDYLIKLSKNLESYFNFNNSEGSVDIKRGDQRHISFF